MTESDTPRTNAVCDVSTWHIGKVSDLADLARTLERELQQKREEIERARMAIVHARDAVLFEDGVSADLHEAGIEKLADAYLRGRHDTIDEIAADAALQENSRE